MPVRTTRTRRVLHIADAHSCGSDPVTQALRACGGEVERCTNVYQGLARMGRAGADPIDVVVLCLDYLTSGEYEFIPLTRECAPDVPIFVHCGGRFNGDVSRALQLGAKAAIDLTPEALADVLGGAPERQGTAADGDDDSAVWLASADEHGAAEGRQTGPIRVPWSRGSDLPARRPPRSPVPQDDADDAPLLTPEEIACLVDGHDGGKRENDIGEGSI